MPRAKKKAKVFTVPTIFLWAAGKRALTEGRFEDVTRISSLLDDSINYFPATERYRGIREKHFRLEAKSLIGSGIIPFTRDRIDLAMAASIYGETGSSFNLYSERSVVSSGYLRVRNRGIDYVDCVKDIARTDKEHPEVLSAVDMACVHDLLDNFERQTFHYKTISDERGVLEILGDFGFCPVSSESLEVDISLWVAPEKDASNPAGLTQKLSRSLGMASLKFGAPSGLILGDVSPLGQLELAAASMVGRWLLIESEEIKIFGELPDLTIDDDAKKVAVDSSTAFRKFLLGSLPKSYIPQSSASYIANLYTWCVPHDPQIWLESISQ